jgi:hypothetical protein
MLGSCTGYGMSDRTRRCDDLVSYSGRKGGGSDEINVYGAAGRGKEKEDPCREQRASWEFNNAVIVLRNVFLDASARDSDSSSHFDSTCWVPR